MAPFKTRWHITIGTYGCRLHGGPRPTVDRDRNRLGDPHVIDNPLREEISRAALRDPPMLLSLEQRLFIESIMPGICLRGGWDFIQCAAAEDHMHVVLDIPPEVHGKQARKLLKRWTSQAMNEKWPQETRRVGGFSWWAEAGSTRAVRGEEYRMVIQSYVENQRATPSPHPEPRDPI